MGGQDALRRSAYAADSMRLYGKSGSWGMRASCTAVLPGCFSNSGDLALVCQLAEANAAYAVVTQISVRTAANLAAVILTAGKLCGTSLLDFHRCLSHGLSSYALAKGAPMSVSSCFASSSVLAVVTMAMFMPRSFSILSYSISGKIICSLRPKL